jgi:hypothetical protein
MSLPRFQRICSWAVIALTLLVVSCAKSRFKQVYPVKGRVLVDGKPEAGIGVRFHSLSDPNDQLAKPSGGTDADGWFTLSTYYPDDGIPVGTYAVTLVWLPPNYRGAIEAGNKLPMRYSDATTSGFKVEIVKGENVLPPLEVEKKK